MKLRFNLGAIIKFYLLDGTSESGKVINVYPDEVELLEQIKIVKKDNHSYYSDKTADGKSNLPNELGAFYRLPFLINKKKLHRKNANNSIITN